jgi:hypothetical protein
MSQGFVTNTVGCFLFFCVLFQIFKFISIVFHSFQRLNDLDKNEFCFWEVTLTQNFISFPLAIWSLKNLENDNLSILTMSIIVSHALFDVFYWICMKLYFGDEPNYFLFLHHLVIFYVCGIVGFFYLEYKKNVLFFIMLQVRIQ